MFGSGNYLPGELASCRDLNNVGTSSLFCDCAYSSVVSSVGHSLLDCRIYQNPDHLAWLIVDEESAQGYLAPVTRPSPEK